MHQAQGIGWRWAGLLWSWARSSNLGVMVSTWPRGVPVGLAQRGVSERCFQTAGIQEMKKRTLLYYVWDESLEEWWAPPTHPPWGGPKLFIFGREGQALLFGLHIWTCLLRTRTFIHDLHVANEETKTQKGAPNLAAGSHSKCMWVNAQLPGTQGNLVAFRCSVCVQTPWFSHLWTEEAELVNIFSSTILVWTVTYWTNQN